MSTLEQGPISPVRLAQLLAALGINPAGITVVEQSPTAIIEGQVVLTGAAQQLPNEPCKSITMENPATNAIVCVGHDNNLTLANGYRLQPGANISLAIDNANRIWVIGTGAQTISYVGVD